MSNQSKLLASVRAQANRPTGTYNEAWMDLAADGGFGGTFNEAFLLYLQDANGSSQGNLPGLKSAFAAAQGGSSSQWQTVSDTWEVSTEPFIGSGGNIGRWGDVVSL